MAGAHGRRPNPQRDVEEKRRGWNSTFEGNVRSTRNVTTCHSMTSKTALYRLGAAVTLLGIALVAVVLGGGADRQYCGHSQRATSTVNANLVSLGSPTLDRGAAYHARSVVDAGQATIPHPECDSDAPAGELRAASTRSARLTDHNDEGAQQTSALSLNSDRESEVSQVERPSTSPLVSRAQGTLGTVRSVVLRL